MKARKGRPSTVADSPEVVIRAARTGDFPSLLRLARILDSINLATEPKPLRALLARSVRAFASGDPAPAGGVYVFVAELRRTGRIAGASMIIAKHGTPESPHYFLDLMSDDRYSKTLQRMFRHTYLRLRHSMDGPTEIGGLVVDPRLRRHPARIGTQLSFVRFLYMGLHRDRFENEVIAEMKPPLTEKGESRFWECYGARVTGLTFQEADRLSSRDKEFIPALFPDVPIYTCMLPLEVQEEIGTVGPDTVGAVRLLEKIGLRFLEQIDPFDAGPYYGAPLDEVSLVRDLRRVRLVPDRDGSDLPPAPFLVGTERSHFRAFVLPGRLVEDMLLVPARSLRDLRLAPGSDATVVPFP